MSNPNPTGLIAGKGEHTLQSRQVANVGDFEELLRELTGLDARLNDEVAQAVGDVIVQIGAVVTDLAAIEPKFLGQINQKLGSNRGVFATLYGACAALGISLNYPTKRRIEAAVDCGETSRAMAELARSEISATQLEHIERQVVPATADETRRLLENEAAKPSKLRKLPDRQVLLDVFNAAAGPLVWSLWPSSSLGLMGGAQMASTPNYMADLRAAMPELFVRRRSLVVRQVSDAVKVDRDSVSAWVRSEYDALDNYGYLALLISVDEHSVPEAWQLASDVPLLAERFNQERVDKGFFRWKWVRDETANHVPGLQVEDAEFDISNEGFTYRDTFVMHGSDGEVVRLLVVMQKNERDERPVPCPACRSIEARGNSYPTLGVKSWECSNPICPDRSIYNRGKRYDFRALLRQEAIEDVGNEIDTRSVRRWQRDVLQFRSDAEIAEMLLCHYSMRGDTAVYIGMNEAVDPRGRNVISESAPVSESPADSFWSSSFFNRYVTPERPVAAIGRGADQVLSSARWAVVEGDALSVLRGLRSDTFDRAITSPPYFNAREYSQWPNLYCYLHDMLEISREVFRTLKPGALYVYNIFDYFDNERIVTFSDMGKKRILLSALMVDVFRRVGFDYLGSSVWDKGEIHGKRGFNAGNFSPFYQAPFNCWEHVIIVQKPIADEQAESGSSFPSTNTRVAIHPVVKMVRGQNTYGHTAPYPMDLVTVMLGGLEPGSVVLDPFGGSGTTARGALASNHRCILIERDPDYAELSRTLVATFERDALSATNRLF